MEASLKCLLCLSIHLFIYLTVCVYLFFVFLSPAFSLYLPSHIVFVFCLSLSLPINFSPSLSLSLTFFLSFSLWIRICYICNVLDKPEIGPLINLPLFIPLLPSRWLSPSLLFSLSLEPDLQYLYCEGLSRPCWISRRSVHSSFTISSSIFSG